MVDVTYTYFSFDTPTGLFEKRNITACSLVEMENPAIRPIRVDTDASSQRTTTTSTTSTTTDTPTDSTSIDSFGDSLPSLDELRPPPSPSPSLASKLHLHVPAISSRLLQPFDQLFGSNNALAFSDRRRSRSLSNASVLSTLSSRSSRPATPAHSTAPTPTPTAPSSRQHSPVPSHLSADSEAYQSILVIPSLWCHLSAREILTVSATCKSLRGKLCSAEAFRVHLEGRGWDAEAAMRRTEDLAHKTKKGRQSLHLARTAIGRGDIADIYETVDKARISIGEKEIDKKLGTKKVIKREYTTDEKRVVEKLLRILIDCATEHDKNNFATLTTLVTESLKPPHSTFIHFLSSIPSYNWKSCYRKAFILAAYLNQQPNPAMHDEALDHLASEIDFWRDGAQKVEKSLSLNNTRAALLYSKGLTAYLPPHLRSAYISRKLSSKDYDPPAPNTAREVIPGLGKAIKRLEDASNRKEWGNESLELEGAYWKPRLDDCPCSPMHMSISPAKSSASETNTDSSQNLVRRSTARFKSSLSSLSIPNIASLSHAKSELQFDITVSDGGANPPWTMSCVLDCETGRGQMVGSSRAVVYDIWVTPWGIMGHKMMISKTGGEGESLGNFVLVWGQEKEVSVNENAESESEPSE